VRAHRSKGGNGGSVLPPGLGESEREGMSARALDDSGDAPLHVEQLVKTPGRARHVEDTRRRWPEMVDHHEL
jgi:hypothetical protein